MSDMLELEKLIRPPISETTSLKTALEIPSDFRFDAVPGLPIFLPSPTPDLGPLAAFVGTFAGNGFNTIFRPDNPVTPTALPIPVSGDNILELNLTSETLSFSPSLGAVPNRGEVQGDINLNGVPYLQSIADVTTGQRIGIHFEPGLWMIVPATTNPPEGVTVVRMASIPHGTTIEAQGTFSVINGPPVIPAIDITPFAIGGGKIRFASQTASASGTARIPQDLTPFIAAGTITQAMLDDPNSVLRDHIASQNIVSTTVITVATNSGPQIAGGGTDNIDFLQINANAVQMMATFWIETVEFIIEIPPLPLRAGALELRLQPQSRNGARVPTFIGLPPIGIPPPRTITVKSTQIQYSQVVLLNFNGLSWPHVSVATLVPADPIPIPGWA